MSKCSIVIPVFNRAFLTRQCLDTLLACPPRNCTSEIIVVDDGSSDSTPTMLADYGDRIRVVSQQNAGFATACNNGAAAATGDYVVFLNNDTIPLTGWLDALVDYAVLHPRAGAIGSKLLYPHGAIQHAGVVIMQDLYPRHVYHGFPSDHPAVNKSRRFQIVTAACILLPRPVWRQLGGFDTAFRNGYEDHDLCLRAGELGHEVHYCPESVLIHLESVSEGRNAHADHNTEIFNERWRSRLACDEYYYYFEDGLLQLTYQVGCPQQLKVSPLLAVVQDDSASRAVQDLLMRRAQQVHELLKENILLRVAAAGNGISVPGVPVIRSASLPAVPSASTAARAA